MLTLYDYCRSSASYRVRIALHLKGVDFNTIPVHLTKNGGEQHSSQYEAINPHHLVPALQEPAGIITQSLAIIEYLEECYKAPPLLPQEPFLRAKIRAFALSIAADIHPLNNLRVLRYLTTEFAISDDEKNQWYQHWIQLGLQALETQLSAESTTQACAFGDTPSIADICLIPQLYNARRFNCVLDHYPRLLAIDAYCNQLPAFCAALPVEPLSATA